MAKTKSNKQTHLSAEEVRVEMDEQKEQEIDKACALEVEEVFKKHNRALQPYIQRSDFADVARVRLVRVPATTEANGEATETA